MFVLNCLNCVCEFTLLLLLRLFFFFWEHRCIGSWKVNFISICNNRLWHVFEVGNSYWNVSFVRFWGEALGKTLCSLFFFFVHVWGGKFFRIWKFISVLSSSWQGDINIISSMRIIQIEITLLFYNISIKDLFSNAKPPSSVFCIKMNIMKCELHHKQARSGSPASIWRIASMYELGCFATSSWISFCW